MRKTIAAISLVLAVVWLAAPASGATGTSTWTVSGGQILLDGKPFLAKGVTYAPSPVNTSGHWPPLQDWFRKTSNIEKIWQRDIPEMRAMGANVIKTYEWWGYPPYIGAESWQKNYIKLNFEGSLDWSTTASEAWDHTDFLDALWNNGDHPIYVLIGIGITAECFENNNTGWGSADSYSSFYLNTVKWAAQKYGKHPAVMGFIIGNEQNSQDRMNGSGRSATFWPKINEMAEAVKTYAPGKLRGAAWQGWWVFNGGFPQLDGNTHFDFWGANLYNGKTFGDGFWNDWKAYVAKGFGKPLLITEWGSPTGKRVGNVTQESVDINLKAADWIASQWKDITDHYDPADATKSLCAGGTVFEWSDEWWKIESSSSCANGTPHEWVHDASSKKIDGAYPSDYYEEEWWGLNRIEASRSDPKDPPTDSNGNFLAPDKLTPRAGYTSLQGLWTKGKYDTPHANLDSRHSTGLLLRPLGGFEELPDANAGPFAAEALRDARRAAAAGSYWVTVGLDPGSFAGQEAEWFLLHIGPAGMRQWDPANGSWKNVATVTPLFAAPLQDLADVSIPAGILAPGVHVFTFGVDLDVNGRNDNDHWFVDTDVVVVP